MSAPGDGSAAVPPEPRRFVITAIHPFRDRIEQTSGPRLRLGESVTVEEVGPVSEAQESVARMRELTESVRARNARIHEGVAEVEAGARALEGESTTTLMQRRSAARAVLSAAREVKSDGSVEQEARAASALDEIVSTQRIRHPLPWRIESDWTEEVVAADGYCLAKCRDRADAEHIVAVAERATDAVKSDGADARECICGDGRVAPPRRFAEHADNCPARDTPLRREVKSDGD